MSDPILELLAAPPSPAMSVDGDAVLAGGRRRLRRRNLRRAGLGAGAAAAAAAVAFAVVGSPVGGSALPAAPSPTAPSALRVSAPVLDGRYAVEVVPGAPANQPNVVFYKGSGSSRQRLAGSSATPNVVSMGTGGGAEGVMLGTAPADATGFLTVTRHGGAVGFETDQQPLPGTDLQAVAVDFDLPGGEGGYLDTIWLDGSGAVRHANGGAIPSVVVPGPLDPGTQERIFVARPAGQLMGMISSSGGSYRLLRQSGTTVHGVGAKPEGGGWTWRSSALLPAGAKDVTFRWSPAYRGDEVSLLPLPDGSGLIATSTATAPAATAESALVEVRWTDAAGTRHTDTVE